MSRTKNLEVTETEKEVTENLEMQPELEDASKEEVLKKPEIENPVKAAKSAVKPGVSTMANKAGKMGVAKFLMLYPQDKYIETLLKFYYPKSFFTKDDWFLRIQEIRKKPVTK